MRFSMGLSMTEEELDSLKDIEQNYARHFAVINDIYSWEKELLASKLGHQEGSAVFSSVQVMAQEANISPEASKRVLFSLCREWELCHMQMEAKWLNTIGEKQRPEVLKYIKGLEYLMSGNEMWSRTSSRYNGVSAE